MLVSIPVAGLRGYASFLGFAAALLHFVLSGWLWRDYMYNDADFDSEDSYAPSGLAKSMFMLASFIVLLAGSVLVSILIVEQNGL